MNATIILALMISLSLLTGCTTRPPRAPNSTAMFGEREMTYRRGYFYGVQDGKLRIEENFERHHKDYKKATATTFAEAYKTGYQSGEQRAVASDNDRADAYQQGFDAGAADAGNELRPSHQRHRLNYTVATEVDFQRGYLRGFHYGQE